MLSEINVIIIKPKLVNLLVSAVFRGIVDDKRSAARAAVAARITRTAPVPKHKNWHHIVVTDNNKAYLRAAQLAAFRKTKFKIRNFCSFSIWLYRFTIWQDVN